MTSKVFDALVWIKTILDDNSIPYQVVGGFAAYMYGGTRPIADIDMYIPAHCAPELLASVQGYVSKPLTHCVEGSWDLEYLQLIFQNQKIEIGLSPGTKLLNKESGEWAELKTDYSISVIGTYEGLEVPVIPIRELIAYKGLLDREVDRIDISELKRNRIFNNLKS